MATMAIVVKPTFKTKKSGKKYGNGGAKSMAIAIYQRFRLWQLKKQEEKK